LSGYCVPQAAQMKWGIGASSVMAGDKRVAACPRTMSPAISPIDANAGRSFPRKRERTGCSAIQYERVIPHQRQAGGACPVCPRQASSPLFLAARGSPYSFSPRAGARGVPPKEMRGGWSAAWRTKIVRLCEAEARLAIGALQLRRFLSPAPYFPAQNGALHAPDPSGFHRPSFPP